MLCVKVTKTHQYERMKNNVTQLGGLLVTCK